MPSEVPSQATPLINLHRELGAKMVAFSGYDMPMHYPNGIISEHLHTRDYAGLFDVSHMGQISLRGVGAAKTLERFVPSDVVGLAEGAMRYSLLTNLAGGILDDLIVTNAGDHVFLIVNAACKLADVAHIRDGLSATGVVVEVLEDQALLALQGPAAATVMARHKPDCSNLRFMRSATMTIAGINCVVSRSGYTGEDGFEISVPVYQAEELARTLLAEPEVAPVGLGARDSLRLEAGLCLYGQDIDATTSPVEAGLCWTVSKRRRAEGGFPGYMKILQQLAKGPPRLRVGILPDGPALAREGTEIIDDTGVQIGLVTSGGYGPSVGTPVAMGYVAIDISVAGTPVNLMIRDKPRPARVVRLPFVRHRYHKS